MQTTPSKSGRAPGSHPYPPEYRPRSNSPPSQSYGYDQRRRPSQGSLTSGNNNPFGDSNVNLSAADQPHDRNGQFSYGNGHRQVETDYRLGAGSVGDEVKDPGAVAALGPAASAARGPKIGKGQYAENWTKEDEEAEKAFIKQGMFNWKELMNWRFWIRKKWWYWYVIIVILCVLVGLMTIYHDQIVNWLTPVANWMKNLPAGWTIPIAVLFVLSFPPLFGQEIVCVLVGAVWGLWVGFGIVSAGTFIGEVGNFYAFKYCLRGYAMRLEEKEASYACLAHIVREGGFFLIFVIRLSAIPGHFSTAVFATCGMNIWIFCAATILTLPKQLIIVYLGVIFADKTEKSNKDKIITYTTLIIGLILTAWSAYYIYRKMKRARVVLWRRERLAQKAAAAANEDPSDLTGGAKLNRRISYREMLEQPNDDIEALRPILDRVSEEGPRNYQTPYEMKLVPTSKPSSTSVIITHSSPRPGPHSTPQLDFSEPPSYRTSPVDGPLSRKGTLDSTWAPATRKSALLPANPDPASPSSPAPPSIPPESRNDLEFSSSSNPARIVPSAVEAPIPEPQSKISQPQADSSSYSRTDQASLYELDGPPVKEHLGSYGYHPSGSTETFPSAQPYQPRHTEISRQPTYGGQEVHSKSQAAGVDYGGDKGEGDLGSRETFGYAGYGGQSGQAQTGLDQGRGLGYGDTKRGYQLQDQGYTR